MDKKMNFTKQQNNMYKWECKMFDMDRARSQWRWIIYINASGGGGRGVGVSGVTALLMRQTADGKILFSWRFWS